jgi:hypothetical protein
MSIRSAISLAAMLSLVPLGILAAQQAAAPAGAAETLETPVSTPAAVTSGPAAPQPQYSPLFQVRDSAPALGSVENASMSSGGSNHTIVVSTLVLVLAVVILVLLIS